MTCRCRRSTSDRCTAVYAFRAVGACLRHEGLLRGRHGPTAVPWTVVHRRQTASCDVAFRRYAESDDLGCSTDAERITGVPRDTRQPAKHVLEPVTKSTTTNRHPLTNVVVLWNNLTDSINNWRRRVARRLSHSTKYWYVWESEIFFFSSWRSV